MDELTAEGRRIVAELGQRHGFGNDAVMVMLRALSAGGGTMAQFSHWELGGMGQWSPGMSMIGDMFNNNLKSRVDGLASELAGAMRQQPLFQPAPAQQPQSWQGQSGQSQSQGGAYGTSLFVPGGGGQSGGWWPGDLGQPSSSGAQNDMRYALFPSSRRLAVQAGGRIVVYDTGDHQIGGFGQQQGGDQSITLTSQFGLVRLADLAVVSGDGVASSPPPHPTVAPMMAPPPPSPPIAWEAPPSPPAALSPPARTPSPAVTEDALAKLERLAALLERGLLTEAEFTAAKVELLKRL